LSDQKTPNGHPNTFLYRAHINLNELNDVSGNQMDQVDQNNISSFYNDEYEENKEDSGQLRLKSAQKLYDALQMTAFENAGKEIEMQQPIM